MSIKESLIPANKNHSIKEAALALFLSAPIINLKKFGSLIKDEGPLSGRFQKFNLKKSLIPPEKISDPAIGVSSIEKEIGFSFESYHDGEIDWILRYATSDSFLAISIHSLQYTRWDDFIVKAVDCFTILAEHEPGLYVNFVGLTYLDHFDWIEENPPALNTILRPSPYLPNLLFDSIGSWSFGGNHQRCIGKNEDEIVEYYKISLQKQKNGFYGLSISHNVAAPGFDEPVLLNRQNLEHSIQSSASDVHSLNKDFLAQCLQDEVLEIINLKN